MPELSARIGAERVPTGQFPEGQGGVAAYSSNEREWPRMNAEKGGMATDERGLTRISKNKCKPRRGRRVGLLGFDGQVFCFTEEEEAGHQDGEGDQGEQDTTSVMQVARQETRVHVSAEKPKRHDAHRVGEHGNGDH